MRLKTMVSFLSDVHVFKGLNDGELKLFADIGDKTVAAKDEVLVNEGDRGSGIYLIMEGRVKVFLPRRITGKKEQRISSVKLSILKKGECFGEYSLMDSRPVSASVAAIEPVEILRIPHLEFKQILQTNDRIAKTIYHNILRMLIARLREKDREFDYLLIV